MDLEKPDCDQHWIRIQQMLEEGGEKFLAEAAVFGDYKVIRAQGQWYVYDLKRMPWRSIAFWKAVRAGPGS